MASFDLHDQSTYRVALTNIPKNFSYTINAEYVDALTGAKVHTQYIQVSSNELLGINDLIDTADDIMQSRNYPYAQRVASGELRLDLTVTEALVNPNVAI